MMQNRHRKTLAMLFRTPTSAGIVFADIEALILSLGGVVEEREGSRVPAPGRSGNMSRMTYKGYTARIEFDDRDDLFVGRLLGVHDIISFHADSVGGLHAALQKAVEDYLADCAERGVEPEKPASGKIMLRIRPEVHAAAAIAAKASGKSLNQWAENVFERAARKRSSA